MGDVFGFNDPEFSDRVLRIIEPDDRPAKRTRQSTHSNSGGRLIHVSKWILCSQSEYFKNLLGKNFAESKSKEVEICVGKDETDAFIKLLHSFYFRALPDKNKKFSFEESSIEELIKIVRLSDMFGAPEIVLEDIFEEISKRDLGLDICETLLDFPEHITSTDNFKSLKMGAISDSLKDAFTENYRFDYFTAKQLKILLLRDDLRVDSEEQVWCLFIEWLHWMKDEGE
eukprot:208479_1